MLECLQCAWKAVDLMFDAAAAHDAAAGAQLDVQAAPQKQFRHPPAFKGPFAALMSIACLAAQAAGCIASSQVLRFVRRVYYLERLAAKGRFLSQLHADSVKPGLNFSVAFLGRLRGGCCFCGRFGSCTLQERHDDGKGDAHDASG